MRKKVVSAFGGKKHWFRNILLTIFGLGIALAGVVFIWIGSLKIPDFKSFDDRRVEKSTKIYDRTGEVLLYDIHNNYKRTVIPFTDMGDNIKKATIAVEDSDFYNHHGIRVKSIIRAIIANVLHIGGTTQGGSTITQQVIKNSLLTQDKKVTRKLKEWFLAVKLDQAMPKDEILAIYLNENPYGGSVYGIDEAAKTFFGKEPKDLTMAEAAYMAAIPNAPTYYSPYGKNKDKLEDRKNFILSREKDLGMITQEEFDAAKAEVVEFKPQELVGIKAPHFVFYIKDYLEQKYGADAVEYGGLKVITTLDASLQEKAEKIASENAIKNEKDFKATNTAVVVIDPKTGQILTMVGSRDYFDPNIDGKFNVATAYRQPGSSFKPFVYATAFTKGYTPETVLFDVPTEFNASCSAYGAGKNCYMPDDYDGQFRGPMELKNALAQSINVPAVKLLYLVGIKDAIKTAKDMGIRSLNEPDRYGLTLVLGGGEVSLLDMVGAYGTFANSGIKEKTAGILKITDSSGNTLEEYNEEKAQVLDKNAALTISQILSDNVLRTPLFGANSTLNVSPNVAVKTGTTNLNKDAWMIGYSTSVVVGVWSGNNDNTSMKKGSTVSGPTWNAVMKEALKTYKETPFEEPQDNPNTDTLKPVFRGKWLGGESYILDSISGKLATEFTPPETKVEKIITNVHDILYWVDKSNPLGEKPADPSKDPQFKNWETAAQNWWNKNKNNYPVVDENSIPTEYDNIHTAESKPVVFIITPTENSTFSKTDNITVSFNFQGMYPLQKADIFINGIFITNLSGQNTYTFSPQDIESIDSMNELKIIAKDSVFNTNEASVHFMVN